MTGGVDESHEPPAGRGHGDERRGSVLRGVALVLFVVALIAGLLAVRLAADARQVRADADMLRDGVDRSSLPFDQAVALARLARAQNAPLPKSEIHDHESDHDSPDHEMTPTEHERFEAQWQEAVDAVPKYATVDKIKELEYVRASGETDGAGEHWINWELVNLPFDPARPSMVLMDELTYGEGLELIAYSYWVASDGPPEGFAGEMDVWHRHRGVCFIDGMIMDENRQPHECAGDWFNGENLWMLHAWVAPGVENVYGIFHNVNPLLCDHACGLED